MSEDEALQFKKDALWEAHQAARRVECLKRKVTVLLRAASKAANGWTQRGLRVNDGRIVANYSDGSLDSGIEFEGSDVLKATLVELAEAETAYTAAKRKFDELR